MLLKGGAGGVFSGLALGHTHENDQAWAAGRAGVVVPPLRLSKES
jgi:hypothetical protein